MGKPRLVSLEDLPHPDPGAPEPKLMASEHEATLTFWSPQQRAATIHFKRPIAYRWGPPNDEALHLHPLAALGLESYSVFELKPSPWLDDLISQNQGHPRHNAAHFAAYRHYLITFHDSLFECLAYEAVKGA